MALEDLIRLHTEALIQNTEAVKALSASLAGRTPVKAEPKAEKPAKAVKEESKVEVVSGENGNSLVVVDETGEAVTGALDYGTVRALVLALAGEHRAEIQAINKKHGIASLPDLLTDRNDFATVNDQAKLEAVYADLTKLVA